MKAGELRHRVTIQENRPAQGTLGAAVDKWATLGTKAAKIEPLDGKRLLYAQQIKAEATHKVTLRYRDGLAELLSHKCRLLFWGRVLTIDVVTVPMEWSERIEILCHEVRE